MTAEIAASLHDQALKKDGAQVIEGALWFVFATGIGMLMEYAIQGIIAAQLGPSEFGVFSVALRVFTLGLTVAMLSLPGAVAYFIPQHAEDAGMVKTRVLISNSLWVTLTASLLICGGLYIAAPLLANRIFNEPQLTDMLRILSLAIPGAAVVKTIAGGLRGLKAGRQASLLTSSYDKLLRFVFTVSFLFMGLGILSPALAYLPASMLVLIVGLRNLSKSMVHFRVTRPMGGAVRQLLVYAWPLWISQLIVEMKSGIQPLLLAYFLDTRTTGIFSVAFLISSSFSLVLVAMNFLYLPVVSGIYAAENMNRIRRLYRMVTGWGVMIVYPIALLLFAFPDAFLRLFGPQYLEGIAVLRVLILIALINVGTGAVGSTLLATGKTRTYLKINLFAVSIGIVMSVFLVSSFGLMGAAYGQLLSALIFNGTTMLVIYRMYGMHPFGIHYIAAVGVGAVILLLLSPLIKFLIQWTPWTILAILPLYSLMTALVFYRFGLLDSETQQMVKDYAGTARMRLEVLLQRVRNRR